MNESSDSEDGNRTDHAQPQPSAVFSSEAKTTDEIPAGCGRNYEDDLQDEVEETVRRFGEFVKKTFREASPGERIVAWTNLVLITIGIIAAAIYGRQLGAMQGQLSVMQEQLDLTDRPWIKLLGATANHALIFHRAYDIGVHGSEYVNTGIKVSFENTGRSVALDVVTRADVIFVSMENGALNNPFSYPVQMQKKLCSEPARVDLPINLFPGENNGYQSGDDHDIPLNGKTFTIPNDPSVAKIIAMFVGCVDYRSGVSGKIHQSGFIYELRQAVPDQQMSRGMLTVGNDIPIADIRMERFAFGGFDAN